VTGVTALMRLSMNGSYFVRTHRPRVGRVVAGFGVLVSFAVLLASSAVYAEAHAEAGEEKSTCPAGTGESTARMIQSRYEGIRDVHAKFEQTNESATFAGQPLMSPEPKSGRVVFAKPGKMRWSYLTPEPSIVVSDGQILWIYDVAGESITRLAVTTGFLSGAALHFLLGDGQILESFEVEATDCTEDRITLDLVPREEATYERIGLVADSASGDIVATSVLDPFGNLTKIRFSEIEINRDPKAETFELEIPDGVEVIDYTGSPEG
jgi:outer membrane lipoprotein carrier protein